MPSEREYKREYRKSASGSRSRGGRNTGTQQSTRRTPASSPKPRNRRSSPARKPAQRRGAKNSKKRSSKKSWTYLEVLIEAIVIIIFLYFIAWPLQVTGIGMSPALVPDDRVVVSRAAAFFGSVNRGDIVLCKIEADDADTVARRIIGTPNEVINIKNGVISVNGSALSEAYADGSRIPDNYIVLGSDEYYVIGDNPDVEGRSAGIVRRNDISGKIILRLLPLERFKTLP